MKAFLAALTLKAKIIIACVSALVITGTAVVVGIAVNKEDSYRVLKVFEMTGESFVTRVGSGELETYVGMNLESGDRLTVGDNSTLRISLDNDKYVLLDSGTILELIATGTASDSRTIIKLINGTILNELTNQLSANSSYQISTPKATMAVRGTSFVVSVEPDSEGGYNITENTFEGKVEVELIDSKGIPTGNSVIVPVDKSVSVRTEPNAETKNPAELDGISRFVIERENGEFTEVPEGESPVRDIRYESVSEVIRKGALRSNSSSLMILDEEVVRKLEGKAPAETTTAEAPAPEVTSSVTEAPVSGVAESVPEITVPVEVTTAPTTEIPETLPPITEVIETSVTTVTTPPETTVTEITATRATTTELPFIPPVIDSCKVSFEADGSVVKTVTVGKGETVSASDIPAVPMKTGCSGSWTLGGSSFSSSTEITSDVTVSAKYTLNSYTVTFTDEAGNTIKAVSCNYNETVPTADIPAVPMKTGCSGSWTLGGSSFTSSTKIISDSTVKASYTRKPLKVTFDGIAGEFYFNSGESFAESGYTLPTAPANYFWTVDGTTEFTENTAVTENTSVMTALVSYTVTYIGTDGNNGSVEAVYGSNLLEALADCDDLVTYKWGYNNGGILTRVPDDMTVTEDFTVQAVKLNVVSFNRRANDTTWYCFFTSMVFPGETVPATEIDSHKLADNCAGYTIGETQRTPFTADTIINDDLSVYEYDYTVTYTTDRGEVKTAYITTDLETNLLNILSEYPLPVGYAWAYTDGSGNIVLVDETAEVTADMEVKAVTSYMVTYTYENGTISGADKLLEGTPLLDFLATIQPNDDPETTVKNTRYVWCNADGTLIDSNMKVTSDMAVYLQKCQALTVETFGVDGELIDTVSFDFVPYGKTLGEVYPVTGSIQRVTDDSGRILPITDVTTLNNKTLDGLITTFRVYM